VCESVIALVLADAVLEMTGGDTIAEVIERFSAYRRRVASPPSPK
jgi:hypothetical protein